MSLPIYVIHCKELPNRTAGAESHLRERGVSARFWRAPHGVTWGLATTKEYDPGKVISPGHVSLNLAHWTLWQHLLLTLPDRDVGEDTAIVLEDDAVLPQNFWTQLSDLRLELKRELPDWQFVFLGLAEQNTPGLWNKVTARIGPPDGRLARLAWPWGTHAYMVRKEALPVLLDRMAVAERNMDQQLYQRVLADNRLVWCAHVPGFVGQRTYDYAGSGTPEWAPSTVSDADGPPPMPPPPVHTPPTQDAIAATLILTEPYPCIYRGEGLDMVPGPTGRPTAVWQCAYLDQPCHQKGGLVVAGAVSCEKCEHRLASGTLPDKRPRLPVPDGHFNPSMIEWGGKVILATRDSWGHSKVGLWELTNTCPDWSGDWGVKPLASLASGDPMAPRLEDPRLFVAPHPDTGRDALHASFSLPDGYPPKKVRVGFVRFARDLSKIEFVHLFESPHGNAYEKNWVPFVRQGVVHWVYSSKPQHVVLSEMGNYGTDNHLPWTGGVVRGGAPPVLAEGPDGKPVYYHFFHGCLKRPQGSVYTIGCLIFEAHPPFAVIAQTPTPIAWPDLPAPDEVVTKRMVVFPGGAVLHAGHWHVASGIDDTYCRVFRFSKSAVDAALSDVPREDPPATIRNSPINTGQPLPVNL